MGKGKKASSLFIPPFSKSTASLSTETFEANNIEKYNSTDASNTENLRNRASSIFNKKEINPEIIRKFPSVKKEVESDPEHLEDVPLFILLTTYLSYFILISIAHIRDFFGKIFKSHEYIPYKHVNGYAPIITGFDSLYHRRLYTRIRDVFHRPITGVAGRTVKLLDRVSDDFNKTFNFTGTTTEVLNLSSYNYLGFAQSKGPCTDKVVDSINKFGVCVSSPRNSAGNLEILKEAENLVARFVGKPEALLISQGFSTNSTTIPTLVSKGSLIISDELNHSSIVFGARLSGANIRVYKHNDIRDLERVLSEAIAQGQHRTHRPWKKILLVIEGLYSMEGSLAPLPEIIELKEKYKFYIFLDEAHSIGAMGPKGRGVCDYFGVDPSKIDVMMGTFTKSFGSAGGYIAGDKKLIRRLKISNHSSIYAETISIPVVQQIISSMTIIMGEDNTCDGQRRLETLAFNSRYFSSELRKMGLTVYGSPDSPVIPVLLYHPAKIAAFSRECLNKGIAVVTVSYPATPILTSRVRFCLSASHTKEDLDWALSEISEIADRMLLKNN